MPGYPDTAGYADDLHEHLCAHLDTLLCDPHRESEKRGQDGPNYVQSVWPPTSYNREAGLSRLGSWDQDPIRTVDGTEAPLADGTGRIAHIAHAGLRSSVIIQLLIQSWPMASSTLALTAANSSPSMPLPAILAGPLLSAVVLLLIQPWRMALSILAPEKVSFTPSMPLLASFAGLYPLMAALSTSY